MRTFLLKMICTMAFACSVFTPATLRAQTAAPVELKDESLQQMLAGLGYSPKKLTKGFLIAIARPNNWTISMQVTISPDGTKLGLNSNLGLIDEATVTAGQWVELLVANGTVDPSAFYFDRDQKKLYLHRSLDNRAVTPEFLHNQIEKFANNVVETEKLWAFTK